MVLTPKLEDKCSEYLVYGDLIQAGETLNKSTLSNKPEQLASYIAIRDLSTFLLDPIIDEFGSIEITYGFCSHQLSKKIPGRIAPKLDQHSAFETNSLGRRICKRDGAAVDFYVTKHKDRMVVVAEWIIENLPFDRLYFYGDDRPIHLSYSDLPAKKATAFTLTNSGRRIPKPFVSRGDR
jgi:hypothetical protein